MDETNKMSKRAIQYGDAKYSEIVASVSMCWKLLSLTQQLLRHLNNNIPQMMTGKLVPKFIGINKKRDEIDSFKNHDVKNFYFLFNSCM